MYFHFRGDLGADKQNRIIVDTLLGSLGNQEVNNHGLNAHLFSVATEETKAGQDGSSPFFTSS